MRDTVIRRGWPHRFSGPDRRFANRANWPLFVHYAPVLRLRALEETADQPEKLLRQARFDDVGVTSSVESPVNGKVGGMPRTREDRDVSCAYIVLQAARCLPSVERGQ